MLRLRKWLFRTVHVHHMVTRTHTSARPTIETLEDRLCPTRLIGPPIGMDPGPIQIGPPKKDKVIVVTLDTRNQMAARIPCDTQLSNGNLNGNLCGAIELGHHPIHPRPAGIPIIVRITGDPPALSP
jgi:hypothetical protein